MKRLVYLFLIIIIIYIFNNNTEYFFPSITMKKLDLDQLDKPNNKLNLNTIINEDEFLYYDMNSQLNMNNQTNLNTNNDKLKLLINKELKNILIIINKNISPIKFNTSLQPVKKTILNNKNDHIILPYLKYLNNIFINHSLFITGKNNIIEYKTENEIKYDFDLLLDYKILNNDNPLEIYYKDIIITCSIIIKKLYNNEDEFYSLDKKHNMNIYVSNLILKGLNKKYINDN